MSKRIMAVLLTMVLILTMAMPAFAAKSGSGSKGAGKHKHHHEESSDESSSKKNNNSNSGNTWVPPVETTPTGQPITDAYVAALGVSVTTEAGLPVVPIDKLTLIAFSKYFKLIGNNTAIVAAGTDTGLGGARTLKGPLFVGGYSYTAFAQVVAGPAVSVVPVQAATQGNGTIKFALPAGTIKYCVTANAVAPR
ncbi:MAG: hypothetical protein K6F34_01035 [Lachnospiraceae bacterium]|nr:hypothetical protein [Lachnospiraceae bacterium]